MERESEILGAVGFSAMSVRPGDSAIAMGVGDLPIAATSHFISLMESSALTAIVEFLQPGETTRMKHLDLEVFDAVSIGSEIRATSTCVAVNTRDLEFDCDIYDGERHIAHARMTRATVGRVSFLARTAAQSLNSHP